MKNKDGATARMVARSCGHKEAVRESRRAERYFGKWTKSVEPCALRLYDFLSVYCDQFIETFQHLDADQSGMLARDDFIEVLRNFHIKLPDDADIKRTVSAHVREGTIDYREFLSGHKFIHKQFLMAAYESKKKKKKKKTSGTGGRRQRGKTKVVMPICMQDEGPRVSDGGPPAVYVKKNVHVTDLARFNRDSQPRHPIEDDSRWYMTAPQPPRVHFHNLVRARDVNSLRAAFTFAPEQPNRTSNSAVTTNDNSSHPDLVDRFYKTPLMVACSRGDLDVVKLLVSAG